MNLVEELIQQNADFENVVKTAFNEGINLVDLSVSAAECKFVSPNYLQNLGKYLIRVYEKQGQTCPEEIYNLLSTALISQFEHEDNRFCFVSYSGTPIRILNPYSPLFVDMEGDFLGLRLWEAEIIALEWMEHNHHVVKNKHVLELGCGVALAGFAALERFQAKRVTLCDYNPRVMDNLTCRLQTFPSPHVELIPYDWNNRPIQIIDPDLVVAADCVYDPKDIPSFVSAVHSLLHAPHAQALIVCSIRNPETFACLEQELQKKNSLVVCKTPPGPPRYATHSTHMMNRSWKREDVVLFSIVQKV